MRGSLHGVRERRRRHPGLHDPHQDHWPKLHSTSVLERLNREFGTRTRLVGIFRSETSLLRFVTALLVETTTGRS
jgi:transposase-like protein